MLNLRQSLVSCLTLVCSTAYADVVVTNIDDSGNKSVVSLTKEWAKVVDQSEPNQYMLIQLQKGDFYLVDNEQRMVVSLNEMPEMPAMNNPHAVEDIPKPKVKINKLDSGNNIAGYKTIRYQLTANGEVCSEHFISKELLDIPEIKAFSDSLQKQSFANNDEGFALSPCEQAENEFDKSVFQYGVPLLSKDKDGNELFKIVEIKKNIKLDKKEFTWPKNYEEVSQMDLMQREMQSNRLFNEDDAGIDEGMQIPNISAEEMEQLQEQMKKQMEKMQEFMEQQKE